MNLKTKIRKTLRESYGDFSSYLETKYQDKVIEVLIEGSNKQQWATYNQVILELKHNIKDNMRVEELQYKLTDVGNPNNACIEVIREVIREVKSHTPELERLYHKIMNFE